MSGLAALSECDRVILRAFYGKSAMTSLFYCYFTKRKEEKMKYRKITALIFAVTLGLTTLTACTKQSDEKATESTVAQSSAVSSEEEKDCCKEKKSCCEDEGTLRGRVTAKVGLRRSAKADRLFYCAM